MSFQRKPPKDGKSKDAKSDDGPRQYSSFKRKPFDSAKPLKAKSGFRTQSTFKPNRPESGQSTSNEDAEPISKLAAPQTPNSPNTFRGKAGRDVDAKKTRKVLRALENARAEALANGADLSTWETEFMGSLETRIDTYGSAFRDPAKGALEEPISTMQRVKLKEIHAKATGKEKKSSFGRAKKRAKKSSATSASSDEQ